MAKPVVHELKTWPGYFAALVSGMKTFEFRRDDREPRFAEFDQLHLREWDHVAKAYTGQECWRVVSYVARGGVIPNGYCVMSVLEMPSPPESEDRPNG